MSTMTKAQQREQAEAVERLREWLKPGDTVYCVLRHVSQSGMSRVIQLVKPEADGSMAHLVLEDGGTEKMKIAARDALTGLVVFAALYLPALWINALLGG